MCVGVSICVLVSLCVCVCVCLHRIAIMYIIICCASSCLLSYTRRPEIVKMPRIDWVRDRDRSRNSSRDRDRRRKGLRRGAGGTVCEAGMRKTYMHISLHLYLYPYLYLYLLMCLYLYYVWHTHRTPTAHTHTHTRTRTHIVREIAKGRCHACLCMRMFIIMCASLASPRAVELVGEHCSASSCSLHPVFEYEE